MAKEGFGYLYKGLGAGLLRQATYTTARLGIFRSMMDVIEKDRPSTFAEKVSTHTHAHAHDTTRGRARVAAAGRPCCRLTAAALRLPPVFLPVIVRRPSAV